MVKRQEVSFHSGKFGTALSLQVQTGGRKNSIKEIRSDGLVIVKLACKSVDESSHPLLKLLLSSVFGVDQSCVDVVAGEQGEYKLVSIVGIESQRAEKLLQSAVKKRNNIKNLES
jgi:uncharacterized protein YggU (UPF0235/DUF167 family)